jgi:hypothetical protein
MPPIVNSKEFVCEEKALLQAALEYAHRGWPVFPCDKGKRPLTKHGFKDATTDENQIRAW